MPGELSIILAGPGDRPSKEFCPCKRIRQLVQCQSTFIIGNKVENSSSAWLTAQTTPDQEGETGKLPMNSIKTSSVLHSCFALLFPVSYGENRCFLSLHYHTNGDRASLNAQGKDRGFLSPPNPLILLATAHTIPCADDDFVMRHLPFVTDCLTHCVYYYLYELGWLIYQCLLTDLTFKTLRFFFLVLRLS